MSEFEVTESVAVGMCVRVLAVWIPKGAGCYEYAIERDGGVVELSDMQYGSDVVALRDGLSYYLDGPGLLQANS